MKYTVHLKALATNVTIDWETLPESSKEYLILNGIRQSLADSYAGAKPEEALGLMEKRLQKILDGTMGQRESDPLQREITAVIGAILASPQYKNWNKDAKAAARETLRENPKVIAAAQQRLDAQKALGNLAF